MNTEESANNPNIDISNIIEDLNNLKQNEQLLSSIQKANDEYKSLEKSQPKNVNHKLLLTNDLIIFVNDTPLSLVQNINEVLKENQHLIYIDSFSAIPTDCLTKALQRTNFDTVKFVSKGKIIISIRNAILEYATNYIVKIVQAERGIHSDQNIISETFIFEVLGIEE